MGRTRAARKEQAHDIYLGLSNTDRPARSHRLRAEATDGRNGKIDESSNEIGSAYVVVDTGSPRMMWQLAGRCRRVRSAPVNVMEGRGQ